MGMKQFCDLCDTDYDDLDHLTYCPHAWFPDVKEDPWKSQIEIFKEFQENQTNAMKALEANDMTWLRQLANEEFSILRRLTDLSNECISIRAAHEKEQDEDLG
jgi:hypothetical protein